MATADEYADWIVKNHALKGTPDFDTVAQAYREAKAEPAAVQAGNSIRGIPRQVGLTVRHAMEGLGDAAGIVTEPVRKLVVNPIMRATGLPEATQSARELASGAADTMGLPTAEGANERVVGDVTRLMAGGGGMAATARRAAEAVSNPIARTVTTAMGSNPGAQVASAGGAGAAGGSVRESGGSPVEEFGASLVGGLSAAGMSALAVKAYNGVAGAVGQLLTPRQSMAQINVTLNQILEQNGVDVSRVPAMVRSELAHEVRRSLDTGRQLNPDVVRRIADYGIVGATPTRGTVTLDPVQITKERNLAKLGANSDDPVLQELPRIQNQNNATFIRNLNNMGGNTAMAQDPRAAGEAAIGSVTARDTAARGTERGLYARARDSAGRPIELDREAFIQSAYNSLGESNKGAFLPAEIRSLLEQIRTGRATRLDGTEIPVPFNADVIDNLKTVLSRASRSSQDGNVRAAVADVRNALEGVQPRATGRPVGGNQVVDPAALSNAQTAADASGAEAISAFDRARRYARGLRNWRESSPGVSAALDDPNPDRFVQDFIISTGGRGQTAHVEALMHNLRRDPPAAQAVKESVVGYLKNEALSGARDEVGNFSQSAFNAALNKLGDAKLRIFFSPEEMGQLRALGRVSSYEMVQPKGSAVNNSNTAGTIAGLLDRIASSALVGRIPFGDAAVRQPARNWSTQIGVNNALDAGGAAVNTPRTPAQMRLEQLIGPGLLLTAPRAEGRDNDKRN